MLVLLMFLFTLMIFKVFTEDEFIKKSIKNKRVHKLEDKENNNSPYELIRDLVHQIINKNK